jgi:hypothetical protein
VRYLLVENTFSYINIEHFNITFYPDPGAAYGSAIPQFDKPTSYDLDSANDYVMHVINGFDVMDNILTTDQRIGMNSYCYINGIRVIQCKIAHTNTGDEYYVREWRVDVVVYQELRMKNDYYGGSFIRDYYFIYRTSSSQISLQVGLSSVDNLLFYGFSGLVKNMSS